MNELRCNECGADVAALMAEGGVHVCQSSTMRVRIRSPLYVRRFDRRRGVLLAALAFGHWAVGLAMGYDQPVDVMLWFVCGAVWALATEEPR